MPFPFLVSLRHRGMVGASLFCFVLFGWLLLVFASLFHLPAQLRCHQLGALLSYRLLPGRFKTHQSVESSCSKQNECNRTF